MMKLSHLMNLPTWAGHIILNTCQTKVQLRLGENGQTLEFRYQGAPYYIHDQEAKISEDGRIFIRVKPRNRMSKLLPTGIGIYLIDTEGKSINSKYIYSILGHNGDVRKALQYNNPALAF